VTGACESLTRLIALAIDVILIFSFGWRGYFQLFIVSLGPKAVLSRLAKFLLEALHGHLKYQLSLL
jgi:hypothetical protein